MALEYRMKQGKSEQSLPRECTGHSKHPLPTTQEKALHMDITEIRLIIFFAAKDGEILYNQQKTRQGADCGSDHEFLIAKFRFKLKKVGKTTRPSRSVQFSHSVVSDSLRPHGLQYAGPPCPSPTPGVYSNSCPLSGLVLTIW